MTKIIRSKDEYKVVFNDIPHKLTLKIDRDVNDWNKARKTEGYMGDHPAEINSPKFGMYNGKFKLDTAQEIKYIGKKTIVPKDGKYIRWEEQENFHNENIDDYEVEYRSVGVASDIVRLPVEIKL